MGLLDRILLRGKNRNALRDRAKRHVEKGKYAEAEPFYHQALSLAEAELGGSHPEVGTIAFELGDATMNLGDHKSADPILRRALAILQDSEGRDEGQMFALYGALTKNCLQLQQYDHARAFGERALECAELAYSPRGLDSLAISTALRSLADVYKTTGELSKALELCQRAVSLSENELGTDNFLTEPALEDLAEVYESVGKKQEARELFQRGLSILHGQLKMFRSVPGTRKLTREIKETIARLQDRLKDTEG